MFAQQFEFHIVELVVVALVLIVEVEFVLVELIFELLLMGFEVFVEVIVVELLRFYFSPNSLVIPVS